MKKVSSLISLIFCLVLIPLFSFAATEDTFGGSVGADITPANPGPNAEFSVQLTSYEIDLNSAIISWTQDGKKVLSGTGKTTANFLTKAIGKKTTINIVIDSSDGTEVTKVITITPGDIFVLWQADTYVPTLYKGKALPGAGSKIRLVAYPTLINSSGRTLKTSEIKFTWKINGENQKTGTGLNIADYTLSNIAGETEFYVSAQSLDSVLQAEKTITIESFSPQIFLYEENAVEGTRYSGLLGDKITLNANEATVRAEPFFLSNPIFDVVFGWALNNNALSEGGPSLALRYTKNSTGSASVTVLAGNKSNSRQVAKKTITVQYGNQ